MRIAVFAAALASQAAGACEMPAGAERMDTARFRLALVTDPQVIRPGQFFAVIVAVCPKDEATVIETLRVDAQMPEHRHGMNYAPRVVATALGRYRAEGLMFHMPGRWEFIVDLRAEGRSDRATSARQVR